MIVEINHVCVAVRYFVVVVTSKKSKQIWWILQLGVADKHYINTVNIPNLGWLVVKRAHRIYILFRTYRNEHKEFPGEKWMVLWASRFLLNECLEKTASMCIKIDSDWTMTCKYLEWICDQTRFHSIIGKWFASWLISTRASTNNE